jgi:hypothetical protein
MKWMMIYEMDDEKAKMMIKNVKGMKGIMKE